MWGVLNCIMKSVGPVSPFMEKLLVKSKMLLRQNSLLHNLYTVFILLSPEDKVSSLAFSVCLITWTAQKLSSSYKLIVLLSLVVPWFPVQDGESHCSILTAGLTLGAHHPYCSEAMLCLSGQVGHSSSYSSWEHSLMRSAQTMLGLVC